MDRLEEFLYTRFPRLRKKRWVIWLLIIYSAYENLLVPLLDTIGRFQVLESGWPTVKTGIASMVHYSYAIIHSSITTWLIFIIGFAVLIIDQRLARKRSLEDAEVNVILRSTRLDPRVPDTETNINYKAKLIGNFESLDSRPIHFLPLRWVAARGDVGVQAPFAYSYRTRADENTKWVESPEVTISPRGSFQVWIGLDKSVSHDELEKRRNGQKLGTISFPVQVSGETGKLEYRV